MKKIMADGKDFTYFSEKTQAYSYKMISLALLPKNINESLKVNLKLWLRRSEDTKNHSKSHFYL